MLAVVMRCMSTICYALGPSWFSDGVTNDGKKTWRNGLPRHSDDDTPLLRPAHVSWRVAGVEVDAKRGTVAGVGQHDEPPGAAGPVGERHAADEARVEVQERLVARCELGVGRVAQGRPGHDRGQRREQFGHRTGTHAGRQPLPDTMSPARERSPPPPPT